MHQCITEPTHRYVDLAFLKSGKRIDSGAAFNDVNYKALALKVTPRLRNIEAGKLGLMLPVQLHPQTRLCL
jgi:hypothetical protein